MTGEENREYNFPFLGGKSAEGVLDTAEKVKEFYQRLKDATKERFKEFDRARRASYVEAQHHWLD